MHPEFCNSIDDAKHLVASSGAALLNGIGPTAADAKRLMHELLEPGLLAVPEPARVFEGGEQDRKQADSDHNDPLLAHTDGFAYGDLYPDWLVLVCVQASSAGGESFLVDGYDVLRKLETNAHTQWVADALREIAVDQTEEGMQPSVSPIVLNTPAGRLMVRRILDEYGNGPNPAPESANKKRDAEMIRCWTKAIEEAQDAAPRFHLEPGQALLVDNYRMFHGREGYRDPHRMMWRVWGWSDQALGVPDMPLHSDTRYAHAKS